MLATQDKHETVQGAIWAALRMYLMMQTIWEG
jgi:hypothetical protein